MIRRWNFNNKLRSVWLVRYGLDLAMMFGHDPLNYRQAQSCSAALCRKIRLEKFLIICGSIPWPLSETSTMTRSRAPSNRDARTTDFGSSPLGASMALSMRFTKTRLSCSASIFVSGTTGSIRVSSRNSSGPIKIKHSGLLDYMIDVPRFEFHIR